jgi:hypothetical protein
LCVRRSLQTKPRHLHNSKTTQQERKSVAIIIVKPTLLGKKKSTLFHHHSIHQSRHINMKASSNTAPETFVAPGDVKEQVLDKEEPFDSNLSMIGNGGIEEEVEEYREPSEEIINVHTPRSETEEERALREEQESIELARALMAEEAMASYSASLEYLRHNQNQFSQADFAMLQAIMDEEQQEQEQANEQEEFQEGDVNHSGLSYDMMLRLGEQLGDVKSERWSQVAKQKIEALALFSFNPDNVNEKEGNDCDAKCLICQCPYELGDTLRKLPCGHCFHATSCVDQWLMSKDFCPYCRSPLENE